MCIPTHQQSIFDQENTHHRGTVDKRGKKLIALDEKYSITGVVVISNKQCGQERDKREGESKRENVFDSKIFM